MEQHEPGTTGAGAPPQGALDVFGDQLSAAVRYADLLATVGVERGVLGPREVPRIWDRHVLNCAVLGELLGPGERLVDVGSGAGLPGIAVALARPDVEVVLVEPLLRRATFLSEVVAELGLSVQVVRGRAEDTAVVTEVGGADAVTARAVAPLGKLVGWCLPLARSGGRVLAMKGASAEEEVARDRVAITRRGVTELRVRECGAGVVEPLVRVVEVVRGARGPGRRRR